MSGLVLNYDKSVAVWLGRMKYSDVRYMPELGLVWNPETFKVLGIIFSVNLDDVINLNYATKLNGVKKILNFWSRRNLTPFGKITVVKTFAVSQLTYLFSNVPDPPGEFLKELQKILFEFVWNKKPDKINRKTMCQSYEAGGMKMMDVKDFLSALKITWLKRALENNENRLYKIVHAFCPLIANINQRGGEFVHLLKERCTNPFWQDVFKHFKMFTEKCVPLSTQEFYSECLFYNINICREKKVLFMRQWVDNNITCIGNLIDMGGILSYENFKVKYPNVNTNFIQYGGIVRSIRNYAQRLGITIEEHYYVVDVPVVWRHLTKGNSKYIYSCLIKKECSLKCIDKWMECTQSEIDTKKVFQQIMKTTSDTCLRWFQYRLIYRLLPTQRFLFLRKMSSSSTCTFCKLEEETLVHLFWDCNETQAFWNLFADWLHANFAHCSNLRLSKQLILFGFQTNVHTDKIIDLFILLAKYHIFTCKIKESTPNMRIFERIVKQRFVIERFNATLDNNTGKFNMLWRLYKPFFQET